MMRILLVEDDKMLGAAVQDALVAAGDFVWWLDDGEAAAAMRGEDFDCVILDWRLPAVSGIEVLAIWRRRDFSSPVLMLTARDAVSDRIAGLDAGADDYLVKPFAMEELMARLRVLARRRGNIDKKLIVAAVSLDLGARRAAVDGREIVLTAREFRLLEDLFLHVGHVRTREQLEQVLYGFDDAPDSNTLEVYIHTLRAKLGGGVIRTMRGVGYFAEKKQ